MSEITKVIVVTSGGVVQTAYSSDPTISIQVLDYDDEQECPDKHKKLMNECDPLHCVY